MVVFSFLEVLLFALISCSYHCIGAQDCNLLSTRIDHNVVNPSYYSYEIPSSLISKLDDTLYVHAQCTDFRQEKADYISRTLAKTENYYYFKVENGLEKISDFFIEVENSHNNLVGLYSRTESNWQLSYLSGDHINQNERNYDHRSVVFPIELSFEQEKEFIVMIDMMNSSYALPLNIWEKEAFHSSDYYKNLIFGGYIGFVTLIIFFVLLSLIFMANKRLYLYYLFYLLGTTLFVLSDLGFADQLFWPNSFYLDEPMTFIGIFSSVSFFMLFASELLDIKSISKKLIYIRNVLLLIIFLELAILFSPLIENPYVFTLFFDLALYLIFLGLFLAMIFGVIAVKYRKKMAVYFVIAFSLYILGSSLKPLALKAVIPFSFAAQYGVLVGHTFEVLILSIVLVFKAWYTIQEKQLLTKQLALKEKENFHLLAKGEYSERKRLSSVIHDGISPKLAYLTMKLSSIKTENGLDSRNFMNEIVTDIQEISADLRNLSRSISPIQLKEQGLMKAAKELIGKLEQSSNLSMSFDYVEGSNYNSNLFGVREEAFFFTLNELLQNIITHNEAKYIGVTLQMGNKESFLKVIDDGFPILTSYRTKGIGIKNIKSRADVHGGFFSQSREGTNNIQKFVIRSDK